MALNGYEFNDNFTGTVRVPVLRKTIRSDTAGVIAPAARSNTLSRQAAETALAADNATYWTAARLNRSTYNDLILAVRQRFDPLNLNVRQV